MIPVVTSASGEAFFKLYPGSRPCDVGMGESGTVNANLSAHFFL